MYYIFQNGDDFGFKCDEVHEITDTDVLISDEIYQQFFDTQCCGKSLRIKDINGSTFDEIFEEYTPQYEEPEPSEVDLLRQEIEELKKQIQNLIGPESGLVIHDGGAISSETN